MKKYKAIEFQNKDDFEKCLDYFLKEGIDFELPGDQNVIVKDNDLEQIKQMLNEENISFKMIDVITSVEAKKLKLSAK